MLKLTYELQEIKFQVILITEFDSDQIVTLRLFSQYLSCDSYTTNIRKYKMVWNLREKQQQRVSNLVSTIGRAH